jgi:PTH1 family peptidyl-tRNA hydrolase
VKVVCGLGNPGSEYEATRHNVGWWAIERVREDLGFAPFRRDGAVQLSAGRVGAEQVRLIKPLTYMNRSGRAVGSLRALEGFDIARDLLVIVDEVALDVGRLRIRPGGSAGGHNGLKSIEAALGTQDYPRLRIGVGAPPPGIDRADWVLSDFPKQDRAAVLEILPDVSAAVRAWIEEGVEAAMTRFNR